MQTQSVFGDTFKGLRVLITGHTGFKGSWLCIWLKELGAEVTGLSRDSDIPLRNSRLCGLSHRIAHHVRSDIRDLKAVQNCIETYQPELVIHMAAQPLVLIAYAEPKETFDTNVGGTVNLLEAVRRSKSVKAFIVVTTDKVYEDQKWLWGYRENDALGGYDPYSASKAMVELCIQSYRRSWSEKGFSERPVAIASVRAGNVIGGGDFAKYRLVPDCMKSLINREDIVLRNPSAVRPWQLVLDPLSGYLMLAARLLRDEVHTSTHSEPLDYRSAWNFGPDQNEVVTCEAVARKAVELWGSGRCRAENANVRPHETNVLRLNWEKAANVLRWRPTYTWQEAVAETVNWFTQYQKRTLSSPEGRADMYGVCVEHIQQYTARARQLRCPWTES
ncbi:MAG: CDP-glucose 4,6-dehydratase [Verrucomicrobia bacterium]|nr:CDP-glucose 4,6-dehydratase [Verrucomicrobiota bacterium]